MELGGEVQAEVFKAMRLLRKETKRKGRRSENRGTPTFRGWGDNRNDQSELKMNSEHGHRRSAVKRRQPPLQHENASLSGGRSGYRKDTG